MNETISKAAQDLALIGSFVSAVLDKTNDRTLCEIYGQPRSVVREAKRIVRGNPATRTPEPIPTGERLEVEENDKSASVFSLSSRIRTIEQLIEYSEIDLEKWEPDRVKTNKWEAPSKNEDGSVTVTMLHQIYVTFKRRENKPNPTDILKLFEARAKLHAPRYEPPKTRAPRDGHLLEISPFDLHLGKLCWGLEVGSDYDLRIAQKLFRGAVEDLAAKASVLPIKEILLPLGNDFFNVDNSNDTTTAGTPQDCDGRWQKAFSEGQAMLVETIDMLQQIAPVHCLMVPGNHDYERTFYLGAVLSAWYRNAKHVQIDNAPTRRKYKQFGKVMLMFTHGNNEKHDRLPGIMSTEKAPMWGETKFREAHVGHLHHKRETQFRAVEEFEGARVRILPSLCAPDDYHASKGYISLRAAEALLWSEKYGYVAQFSHTPQL